MTIATHTRPARDARADICRGIALWMIMVNHTPGNWVGDWTLRNFTLADATEAFVLLAGYAAAFAYAGRADRQGWLAAAAAVTQRIGKLYMAHIFLLVVFAAQVGFSAAALDRAAFLDELALDPFSEQPYRALLEALLLRFQPHFLDVLPLYIVVLALFVPALLLRKHPWLLLGLAVLLWAGVRQTGVNLPRWEEGTWFFNPLAWQLLFFVGFMLGQAVRGAPTVGLPPRNGWLTAAALLVLASGFTVMMAYTYFFAAMPAWAADLLASVDKTALHPWRLATVLALAYFIGHFIAREGRITRSRWARPFQRMGQHSLPVFCFGILLSFLARLALEVQDGWLAQVVVNLACFFALLAIALIAQWNRGLDRAPRAPLQPSEQKV
jgi:hypothetical protein